MRAIERRLNGGCESEERFIVIGLGGDAFENWTRIGKAIEKREYGDKTRCEVLVEGKTRERRERARIVHDFSGKL